MQDRGGSYRLVRIVGSGGMGVVHEAWDTRLERRVALKMLHAHLLEDPATAARFEKEAQKAARVEHPHVVRIYRVDTHEGRVAIEMQFIDGAPLSALLKTGPLSLEHAADLLRQVLEALNACHRRGVIHCDLKPGNLLVTGEGEVILTDFGIARALFEGDGAGANSTTATSQLWGTPLYSPPEAWEGGAITPQWDLYAAGALLYEAIAGVPPFRAPSPAALMNAVLTSTPASLAALRPEISPAFAELIVSLLARDPANRPASANAALKTLRRTPEFAMVSSDTEPLRITPVAREEPVRGKSVRSKWRAAAAAGLVFLAVLGVWIGRGRGAKPGPPPLPVAGKKHDPHAADLFVSDGVAYFSADDGVHGRELWHVTGETFDQCEMVADLVPGPGSSNPRRFWKRPHGGFVFEAATPETGDELWFGTNVSGGQHSARPVKDIIPGTMGSDPMPVAADDVSVLFYATTFANGRELWCTNALTEQQTSLVADIFPGTDSSVPMHPRVCEAPGGAYIVAIADAPRGCVLFRYDYKTNAMREIADVGEDAAAMVLLGNRLLLANTDNTHGYELWAYDEASRDLSLLRDVCPGPESSSPSEFFSWGDRVLFQARTEEAGVELWVSDGTAEGTAMVRDINPGRGDSSPYNFVPVGDTVFFRAKDDACGLELWRTDGTTAGTARVADVLPGPGDGNPYNLVAHGRYLWFTATDVEHGEELWDAARVDGAWEVQLASDLYPGATGSEPHLLQWIDYGVGFFLAKTPELGETVCVMYAHAGDTAGPPLTNIDVKPIGQKRGPQ